MPSPSSRRSFYRRFSLHRPSYSRAFLLPSEFGTVAMITSVTAFANLFRDLGLSAATIQAKELTREQQSTLFWINVLAGALLTLIVAALAPLIAWFYAKPELIWATRALSLNYIFSSLARSTMRHLRETWSLASGQPLPRWARSWGLR